MCPKHFFFLLLYGIFTSSALATGWIDYSTYNHIKGWACQKGSDQAVGIHIWRDDGIFLGGGSASNYREHAVAQACESGSQDHGFDIALDIPPHLIDNKYHNVNVYAITKNGPVLLQNAPVAIAFGTPKRHIDRPTAAGTVVGRDLAIEGRLAELRAGSVGHIGIWDGSRVIEMLNEGGNNKVKMSTWDDFISRSEAWPSMLPRFPKKKKFFNSSPFSIRGCFDIRCIASETERVQELVPTGEYSTLSPQEAVVARAKQIHLIGGKYTILAIPTKAVPGRVSWSTAYCNPFGRGGPCPLRRETAPKPGTYRCDTLVIDAFAISALREWGSSIDATYNINDTAQFEAWRSRMNIIANFTTRTPYTIMHALRSIQ